MGLFTRCVRTWVSPVFLVLLLAPAAQAAPVLWQIDSSLSQITLAVPDQAISLNGTNATVRLRNQSGGNSGPWNVGNKAFMAGTIATDYDDGVSIQFLTGQGNMYGLTSGNYRPNPADFNPLNTNAENPDGQFSGSATAPGVFGARVRATVSILTVDAAYFSFLDVLYDLDSGALPIGGGGTFAGNALSFGFDQTTVAFDGLSIILVGQPIPDTDGTVIQDVFGTNTSAGATITSPDPIGDPNLRRLSIPINVPLSLDLQGVVLNASVAGTIVAYAYVPEPGTLLLLACGVAGLVASRRRREVQ